MTPDDEHRRCPKHVEFHEKIKILDTLCILLVICTKIITMHGHLNIQYGRVTFKVLSQSDCSDASRPGRLIWSSVLLPQ
jgi:hypothetical protein